MNREAVTALTSVVMVGCSFACGYYVNEYKNRNKFKKHVEEALKHNQGVADGLAEQKGLITLLKNTVMEKSEEI